MDQAREQAVQALQALYSSPDPATKKQADEWLVKFQQTPVAWQVVDQILSNDAAPMQFRFFAAQTMRTKVQFDFFELPADSYGNLRESLLNHIDRFRAPESQPIHTMLAIAVADLAIQMDNAGPEVVEILFKRYGQSADSYATLLEILQMLPEEVMNYKLMTDTYKRKGSRERLQQATPQVIQFLLQLQCPVLQAKKKVLECFLSWIKLINIQSREEANVIAQNPLIPECIVFVRDGGELSETATDIIIEVLRMASMDVFFFQPVVQVILSLLSGLRAKFEALLAGGAEAALDQDQDGLLQICRIYVETGECLVPLIMEQSTNNEVLGILQVILKCTDLPNQEVSSIPLEFWHRLAHEVCRHPETDAKIDQFQGIYVELLNIAIRRCAVDPQQDPFQLDDDFDAYRKNLLSLAEDCLDILTPNSGLEHTLKSLQDKQGMGVVVQEAHFYMLQTVGPKAEVRPDSVLWHLIQSLPPLIQQAVDENSAEGVALYFTKKTAIELLGLLWKWVKTRPDFLRSSLEMVSTLLMVSAPAVPQSMERDKQVKQAASMAFQAICINGRQYLHDLVPQLIQLYVSTMALPMRQHQFITEGVACVVTSLPQDDAFRSALEQVCQPLVAGMNSERERPNVLSDILDRLTTIIRHIIVSDGTAKACSVGALITNTLWPMVQQTLQAHPGDPKVVEKSCRVLKHSMRCVPDLFKPIVSSVASTLVTTFQQYQHSSYLYSAEILANTYAHEAEIVPVLTQLFNSLSSTALQCLAAAQNRLEEITELVEDFYGMFERYLRYAPMIVLESPALAPTLQMWNLVIFVQQKDAIEAVIAFIEAVLSLVAETAKPNQNVNKPKVQHGALLRPHALQVSPGLVEAIFKLIAGVPTRYVQDTLPSVLDAIGRAFPQEYPAWLEVGLQQLPPSVASKAEQQVFGQQLLRGDDRQVYDAVQDLCYRCEQVALRNRSQNTSTTNK
jgi:transportin-3